MRKSQFRYGYRRVADTLRKATGIRIADKTVLKVMREEGCCAGPADAGNAAPTWARVSPPLHPPARDFEAEGPTKLVTDVTEFKAGGTNLPFRPWSTSTTTRSSPTRYPGPRNMKMVLQSWRPRGGSDGEDAPLLQLRHGLAVPDARLQARFERMGRPAHVLQRKPPRQREGRKSSRWSRPSFTTIGREATPISSRGIWRSTSTGTTTRAHQETPDRKQPGRVQAPAGLLDSLLLPFRETGSFTAEMRVAVQLCALRFLGWAIVQTG